MNASLITHIENILKLAAVSAGLVAVLGLPAVYQHYHRFAIPAHFIGYDQIIKAGVVPFVLLVGFVGYLAWAYPRFKDQTRRKKLLLVFLLFAVPFFFPPVVIYLFGIISVLLLELWGIGWLTAHGLALAGFGEVSTNVAFVYVLVVFGTVTLLIAAVAALPERVRRRFLERLWPGNVFVRGPSTQRGHPQTAAVAKREDSPPPEQPLRKSGLAIRPVHVLGLLLAIGGFVLLVLAARLFLHVMDWEVPYFTSSAAMMGWIAATMLSVTVCTLAFVVVDWLDSDNTLKQRAAFAVTIVLIAGVFLGVGYLYSWHGYARIPQIFGGGRPEAVDVWLSRDVGPALGKRLAETRRCIEESGDFLCAGVLLLYHDKDVVIVHLSLDTDVETVILDRKAVRGFSAGPRRRARQAVEGNMRPARDGKEPIQATMRQ